MLFPLPLITKSINVISSATCHVLSQLGFLISSPTKLIPNDKSSTKRLTYETVKWRVESRGHVLLSKEYKNNRQILQLICVCGKPWGACLGDIERGSTCHGRPARITLEDAKQLAIERGGECLSSEFKDTKSPLSWRCNNNHEFSKSYDQVRGSKSRLGSWCGECFYSRYIVENICRLLLEEMFGTSFKKSWPLWLRTRNGSQLELDGFCPKLKIAFEYQGEFHYLEAHLRRKGFSKKTFARQIAGDRLTTYACTKNGVKLIVIELHQTGQRIEDLVQKIESQIEHLCIDGYTKIDLSKISINDAYKGSELDDLIKFCERHNGCLKTKVFMGVTKSHEFVCEKGHEFSYTPQLMYLLRDGRFCLTCERKKRDQEVTEECKKKGFEVLSIPEKITDKMSVRCLKCKEAQEVFYYNIKNSKTDNPCGKSCKSKKIAEGVRKYDNDDLESWAENCDYILKDKEFTSLDKKYSVECKHCGNPNLVLGASLKNGKKCMCQKGKRISQAKLKYDKPYYMIGLNSASAELISVDYEKDRVAYKCTLCRKRWNKDRHYVAKGGTVCNHCKTKFNMLKCIKKLANCG